MRRLHTTSRQIFVARRLASPLTRVNDNHKVRLLVRLCIGKQALSRFFSIMVLQIIGP